MMLILQFTSCRDLAERKALKSQSKLFHWLFLCIITKFVITIKYVIWKPREYYWLLCSVDRASLYNLVSETNLVHYLFLVYFVNFVYNLHMFQNSPGPSSGGTTVFMRHLVLVILCSRLICRMEWNCNCSFIPSYISVGYTE